MVPLHPRHPDHPLAAFAHIRLAHAPHEVDEPGAPIPHERYERWIADQKAAGYSLLQISCNVAMSVPLVEEILERPHVQKMVEAFAADYAIFEQTGRQTGQIGMGVARQYALGVVVATLARQDVPEDGEVKWLALKNRVAMDVLSRTGFHPTKGFEHKHSFGEIVADQTALTEKFRALLRSGELEIVDAEVVS